MTGDLLALVVSDLAEVAARMGTRALLVGAYARVLCLDQPIPSRGTNDVDFAVLLESWEGVDEFLESCRESFRDVNVAELLMYHRTTGQKVDIIPCGQVETPHGTLNLRDSPRRINTLGLLECFKLGRSFSEDLHNILIPPPEGFILLKLFAFADRREPRDLRDAGDVVHRFPVDDDEIWSDQAFMDALADDSLIYDDRHYWRAGRAIASRFNPETVTRAVTVISRLQDEDPESRSLLSAGVAALPANSRLAHADRTLDVLRRALSEGRRAQ